MKITKLHFLSISLLIGFVLSDPTQESEEEDPIDLQALLKHVSNSIQTFNTERLVMSKELGELRNTIADMKSTIDDRKFDTKLFNEITKRFDQMVSAKLEDHNLITKQLSELKDVTSKELSEIKGSIGNMSSTMYDLTKIVKKCTTVKPRDCRDIYFTGESVNGIYRIYPPGSGSDGFQVFCDMKTDGGGWTVFQRRGQFGNPADYFYRNWTEYKDGFGNLEEEFWLGNQKISILTNSRDYQLRVDLMDKDNGTAFAKYHKFVLDDENQFYRLTIGGYTGTAVDSLSAHSGHFFSTKDKNNDSKTSRNCAVDYQGAWWYFNNHHSNLNGLNLKGGFSPDHKGIMWWGRTNFFSMLAVEMKIRPNDVTI